MGKDFSLDEYRALLRQVEQTGVVDAVDVSTSNDVASVFRQGSSVLLTRLDHMLAAMTPEERRFPDQVAPLRRHEIAAQSGTQPEEIDRLLALFFKLRSLKRQMGEMTIGQQINLLLFEWQKTMEAG